MNFKPPNNSERLRAIGPTGGLPESLRRAFDPEKAFEPIPVPKPGDWLAEHIETGQSFEEFLRSKPKQPDPDQKIGMYPFGIFSPHRSPPINTLRDYAAAYFNMGVELLPSLDEEGAGFRTRINTATGKRQFLTTDILSYLKERRTGEFFALVAVSVEDLYPHPSWNFVFGQASSTDRVGVFSFARYDPSFYGEKRIKGYGELLLRRCMKVLVHETAHLFSLNHCIFYRCLMNGSNHLEESDSRPLHLCPVCLRKLHYSIGFDIVDRYQRLQSFYHGTGFTHDERWTAGRLKEIKVS